MRFFKPFSSILIAALMVAALRAPASAQVYISLFAPPAIPQYSQPMLPASGYVWTPGYWAYGPAGYYWVPGTWTQPPQTGYYWTPGYWGYNNNQYMWNAGYWGPQVGYYGGINYGAGYYGNGYVGGMWQGPVFAYNSAVTAVPATITRNVYINRTVIVHNVNYTSYNGGPHGVTVRPTTTQVTYMHEHHVAMTPAQQEHVREASADRNYLSNVNHGKPANTAVAKPMTKETRPDTYKPVTEADRKANQQQAHPQEHPQQEHPQQKPPEHPEQKPPAHTAEHAQQKPAEHPDQKPAKPDTKKPPRS